MTVLNRAPVVPNVARFPPELQNAKPKDCIDKAGLCGKLTLDITIYFARWHRDSEGKVEVRAQKFYF